MRKHFLSSIILFCCNGTVESSVMSTIKEQRQRVNSRLTNALTAYQMLETLVNSKLLSPQDKKYLLTEIGYATDHALKVLLPIDAKIKRKQKSSDYNDYDVEEQKIDLQNLYDETKIFERIIAEKNSLIHNYEPLQTSSSKEARINVSTVQPAIDDRTHLVDMTVTIKSSLNQPPAQIKFIKPSKRHVKPRVRRESIPSLNAPERSSDDEFRKFNYKTSS